MYKCLELGCQRTFEEESIRTIESREDGYVNPCTSVYLCPYCDSEGIEKIKMCEEPDCENPADIECRGGKKIRQYNFCKECLAPAREYNNSVFNAEAKYIDLMGY